MNYGTLQRDIMEFINRAAYFYGIMAGLGYPVRFHTWLRTSADQDQVFSSGASKARAGQSPHQFGLALDYFHADHGYNVGDDFWTTGDVVATQVGLQSGLSWGDGNHLQYGEWRKWKDSSFRLA